MEGALLYLASKRPGTRTQLSTMCNSVVLVRIKFCGAKKWNFHGNYIVLLLLASLARLYQWVGWHTYSCIPYQCRQINLSGRTGSMVRHASLFREIQHRAAPTSCATAQHQSRHQ